MKLILGALCLVTVFLLAAPAYSQTCCWPEGTDFGDCFNDDCCNVWSSGLYIATFDHAFGWCETAGGTICPGMLAGFEREWHYCPYTWMNCPTPTTRCHPVSYQEECLYNVSIWFNGCIPPCQPAYPNSWFKSVRSVICK